MRRPIAAVGSSVFFFVGPGTVAGLVPWLLTRWHMRDVPLWAPLRLLGAAMIAAALVVILQAFARFVVEGHGTPVPTAAPERLVVGGIYRHVRNPMYVALLTAILGQALLLAQPVLLLWAAVVWLAFSTFVRLYEEPVLARRFGTDYATYRRNVPAWWPRLRPWTPGAR